MVREHRGRQDYKSELSDNRSIIFLAHQSMSAAEPNRKNERVKARGPPFVSAEKLIEKKQRNRKHGPDERIRYGGNRVAINELDQSEQALSSVALDSVGKDEKQERQTDVDQCAFRVGSNRQFQHRTATDEAGGQIV